MKKKYVIITMSMICVGGLLIGGKVGLGVAMIATGLLLLPLIPFLEF